MNKYFNAKTGPLILTVIIVSLVGVAYFVSGSYNEKMPETQKNMQSEDKKTMDSLDVLKDARFKVLYEDTTIEIFVNANNAQLSKLKFDTGTIVDEMHFVSEELWSQVDGEESLVVKYENNIPNFFLLYYMDSERTAFILSEGELKDYYTHYIAGKAYYPVLVGYKEAEVMRKNGEFQNIGDTIDNYFGKNVIITGVIAESGVLDYVHVVDKDFFIGKQTGVLI